MTLHVIGALHRGLLFGFAFRHGERDTAKCEICYNASEKAKPSSWRLALRYCLVVVAFGRVGAFAHNLVGAARCFGWFLDADPDGWPGGQLPRAPVYTAYADD